MVVPVYTVCSVGYNVPKLENLSGELYEDQWGTTYPVEYHEIMPDFKPTADAILLELKKRYSGKRIGLRLLGSQEHPEKTVDDLIEIISKTGHDRYDSEREGDRYENKEGKHIDIFVLPITLGNSDEESWVAGALESFYCWALHDRNVAVKVDIVIVYDLDKLEVVPYIYKGREQEGYRTDGFVFKESDNKVDAVKEVIKLV